MISGIRVSAHGLSPVDELLFLIVGVGVGVGSLSNDDGNGDENV